MSPHPPLQCLQDGVETGSWSWEAPDLLVRKIELFLPWQKSWGTCLQSDACSDLGCECRSETWKMCKCLTSPVLPSFPLCNFLSAELQGMHQDTQLPVDLYHFSFVLLLLGLP